jgi:hypothetical protein
MGKAILKTRHAVRGFDPVFHRTSWQCSTINITQQFSACADAKE